MILSTQQKMMLGENGNGTTQHNFLFSKKDSKETS